MVPQVEVKTDRKPISSWCSLLVLSQVNDHLLVKAVGILCLLVFSVILCWKMSAGIWCCLVV